MSLQNKVAANPFTGIAQQSINPDDYNFNKGTVAAVGGILETVSGIKEDRDFKHFNETLQNAQFTGGEEGIESARSLIGIANNFRDVKRREAAIAASTGLHDSLAMSQYNKSLQAATLAGDPDSIVNTNMPNLFNPEHRQKAWEAQQKAITGATLGNIELTAQQALKDGDPLLLQSAYDKLKNSTYLDATAKAGVMAKLTPIQNNLTINATAKQLLDGVTPEMQGQPYWQDRVVKEFRKSLPVGITPEQTQAAEANFKNQLSSKFNLGAEAQADVTATEKTYESDVAEAAKQIERKYGVTTLIPKAALAQYVTDDVKSIDTLLEKVDKTLTPGQRWFSSLEGPKAVKTELLKLANTKFNINGVERVPTARELSAVFAAGVDITATWGDVGANSDQFKNTLEGIMKLTSKDGAPEQKMLDLYTQMDAELDAEKAKYKIAKTNKIKTIYEQSGVSPSVALQTAIKKATEASEILQNNENKKTEEAAVDAVKKVVTEIGSKQGNRTSNEKVFNREVSNKALNVIGEQYPTEVSYLTGLIQRENPDRDYLAKNKSGSNAFGLTQFVPSSWVSVTSKLAGKPGMPEKFDITNPEHQLLAGIGYKQMNLETLKDFKGKGIKDNALALMAHGYGANGAKSLLKANPNSPIESLFSDEIVKSNGLTGKTVGQVIAEFNNRFSS